MHPLAPFLIAEQVITRPLSTLSVMFAIYGIYVMVFGLAIRVLSRRDGPSSRLYMGWSINLFVLSTLFVAMHTRGTSREMMIEVEAAATKNYTPFLKYLRFDEGNISSLHPDSLVRSSSITDFVACIMNAIADSMLIHRCCVVWQSKIMMYFLAFLAVVLNGIYLGSIIAETMGLSIPNNHLYNTRSVIDDGITMVTAVFQVLLALLTGRGALTPFTHGAEFGGSAEKQGA
ncbi:hypothetical protein L218DRAFT_986620 [Marasmius fiardii PR-910]|nr:hypothetical protein L218DRAFT_986620 [Marasmius fiardii PR-910]